MVLASLGDEVFTFSHRSLGHVGMSMREYCNVFTNDFFTTINIGLFFKHLVDI